MVDDPNGMPDDVVSHLLYQLKNLCPNSNEHIGYFSPASLELCRLGVEDRMHVRQLVPLDSFSLHIHHLDQHWVTSYVCPGIDKIFVCDSLKTAGHEEEVYQQLLYIYGDLLPPVEFLNVKQQGTDPICGPMAIAFAVDCCLGYNPSQQDYDISKIRHHLQKCILQRALEQFPNFRKSVYFPIHEDVEMKEERFSAPSDETDLTSKICPSFTRKVEKPTANNNSNNLNNLRISSKNDTGYTESR